MLNWGNEAGWPSNISVFPRKLSLYTSHVGTNCQETDRSYLPVFTRPELYLFKLRDHIVDDKREISYATHMATRLLKTGEFGKCDDNVP